MKLIFALSASLALGFAAPANASRVDGDGPVPSVAARAGLHLAQRDMEEDRSPRWRRSWRDEDSDERRGDERPWDRRWDDRRDRYWNERGEERRSRRDEDGGREGYYRERERGASRYGGDERRPSWRGRNSPPPADDEDD